MKGTSFFGVFHPRKANGRRAVACHEFDLMDVARSQSSFEIESAPAVYFAPAGLNATCVLVRPSSAPPITSSTASPLQTREELPATKSPGSSASTSTTSEPDSLRSVKTVRACAGVRPSLYETRSSKGSPGAMVFRMAAACGGASPGAGASRLRLERATFTLSKRK